MALTDEGSGGFNVSMPVAPAYGAGFGNMGGLFGGGGDSWLGILFLIALCNGGWGGFGGFGGGYGAMMGMGMMDGWGLYPWLNNSQNINDGFRDQQLSNQVSSIQNAVTSGFGDVQTALCGGFASVNQNVSQGFASTNLGMCQGFNGVNSAINGAQNALAQQMYSNQIADLERSYAAQTASTAGLTAVQAQLAQNGFINQAATADLKYTVATENCADRAALSDGVRDIIASNTAQTQAILDKLCSLELDGYKRENDQLRSQLTFANMQASQTAQTAAILQGQAAEVDGVYNRLKNCPVPSMPVYGNTPIFTCNSGCGCGA